MANERYKNMAMQVLGQDRMDAFKACIQSNAVFLRAVAEEAAPIFGAPDFNSWSRSNAGSVDKVLSTLRQVAREWSDEGSQERDMCFGKVIREIEQLYPESDPLQAQGTGQSLRSQVKIVIPGCGLGRLPMELAARGFQAQGNEFSFHMLFASHFLLNCTMAEKGFTIHPYMHSFSHQRSREAQTRGVDVPDVHPGHYISQRERDGLPAGDLSMVAGSFDDIYFVDNEHALEPGNPQFTSADVVATVFFLDTAPNIFRTLDTISKLLVTGGRWINFGPLLWHYEDTRDDEPSNQTNGHSDTERSYGLELTLEDVLTLLPQFGFEIEKHESDIPCHYTQDPQGMGGFLYKCQYWVAVKI